jgi:hypothetical protein
VAVNKIDQSPDTRSTWLLYGISVLWGILAGAIYENLSILLALVSGEPVCNGLYSEPCSIFDLLTPITMGIGCVVNLLFFGVTVRLWQAKISVLRWIYAISGVLITLGMAYFHLFLDYAFEPRYPQPWFYNFEGLVVFSIFGLVSLVPLGFLIGLVFDKMPGRLKSN